jgi:hypothetical protein
MTRQRDPKTGELLFPVSMHIHVRDALMPVMLDCRSWAAATRFLAGAEFREMRDRVRFVTITSHGERP